MWRVFAVVLAVEMSFPGAACLADLINFKSIDGPYAAPDATTGSGSVDVWTNTPSGNNGQHGSFTGDSIFNSGGTNNGSAGAGSSAWRLYANSGQTSRSDANIAPLIGRNLNFVGDFISLDFDNGLVQGGGDVGVSFFDSSNAHQLTIRLQGGDGTYEILDNGGVFNTGIPSTRNGFKLTFSLLKRGEYTLNVFNTQFSNPINTTISSRDLEQNTSTIAAVRVYDVNSGGNPNFDVFFDNLTINTTAVPEVSPALAIPFAVVVTGAGVWAARRLRRARRVVA